MKITIILPGRSKESYWKEAEKEYEKRLTAYTKVTITRIKEEKLPSRLGPAETEHVKKKEGTSFLKKLPSQSYLILLDPAGQEFDSPGFARLLEKRELASTKNLVFIIGGALGFSEDIKKRADLLLSFSKMTFTHDMMPTLLLEQLYRGYSILAGSPYHK